MTAGHVWGLNGFCACGKRLSDISFAAYGDEWLEQAGIAHVGGLTRNEQGEIRAEVERVYDAAMEGARV